MKRYLLILIMAVMANLAYSQSFNGFFRPVDKSIDFKTNERGISSQWLARPYFNITAVQINLTTPVTVQSLNSFGTGASWAHFTEVDGEPYQDIAVNVMVLFGADVTEVAPLQLSLAATATFWQHVSIGAGYSFQGKNAFVLTSYSFSFNGQ